MQIEHPDFCLRDITSEDAESYFELYSHPEVAIYDDFTPITREELRIDMARISLYTPTSAYLEFAVAIKPINKLIGVITLDRKNGHCYLGYHFHPSYHRKGYAVRSLMALLESMSSEERIILRLVSHPDNLASLSLADKLGFVQLKQQSINNIPEVVYKFDLEQWSIKRQADRNKSFVDHSYSTV